MTQKSFSLSLLILISSIFIINLLANIYFWYWQLRWLDMLMHFAGGVFIGALAIYLYLYSGYVKPEHNSIITILFVSVLSATFVGVLWEFFEFLLDYLIEIDGFSTYFQGNLSDTLSDLFFDMIGGILPAFIFMTSWKKK